jgi:hypothetical protein
VIDADHYIVAADRCSDGSHQSTESRVPDLIGRAGQEVIAKDHHACGPDVCRQSTISRIQVDTWPKSDDEVLP